MRNVALFLMEFCRCEAFGMVFRLKSLVFIYVTSQFAAKSNLAGCLDCFFLVYVVISRENSFQ